MAPEKMLGASAVKVATVSGVKESYRTTEIEISVTTWSLLKF